MCTLSWNWCICSHYLFMWLFLRPNSLCATYCASWNLISNTTNASIVDMNKKYGKTSLKQTASFIFYFTEYLLYQLWGRAFLESFENHSGSGSSNATQNGVESESEEEEGRPRTRGHGLRPLTRISVRTGAGRNRPMSQPQYLHG